MSIFIPQELDKGNTLALHKYATKIELLNYLQKDVSGSVDLNDKKLSGLALPVDNDDAANKQYVDASKPIICIVGEALRALVAGKASFSFGANSYLYAHNNGGASNANGLVMPVNGRVKAISVCSTTSNGGIIPIHTGIEFTVAINGVAVSDSSTVTILPGERVAYQLLDTYIELSAGNVLNVFSMTTNVFTFITTISIFVELDM